MNLFEFATFFSPVGGAVGGAMAVHRVVPSKPAWMWAAVPFGLACGIGCYRGLIRLVIGRHNRNPDLPSWRMAAILGIGFSSPYIAAALSYGSIRLFLYALA